MEEKLKKQKLRLGLPVAGALLLFAATSEASETTPAVTADAALKSAIETLNIEEDDTAACIQKCKAEYRKCAGDDTAKVPACLKKQKECMDACK